MSEIPEKKDEYLLRFHPAVYRQWPPSAGFVNPVTLDYAYPQDQHFVPQLTDPGMWNACGISTNSDERQDAVDMLLGDSEKI